MNLDFLCCVGADMKNSTTQTTRMSQIYLYRAFEGETVDDMLSANFFNPALGIIREGDLLLLYSPDEAGARYVYARVSASTRNGVEIERLGIQAQDIEVVIAGLTNLTGGNLQEVIESIDANITRIDENIGDMNLPIITDGGTAPENLSQATRELNSQVISSITEDTAAPAAGTWTLWASIKKTFNCLKYIYTSLANLFPRVNALEGRGGSLTTTDLTATPTQEGITAYAVSQIWRGSTGFTWNTTTPADSTFTDSDGLAHTAAEIFNATWVVNLNADPSQDGHAWQLTNTQDTVPTVFQWVDIGLIKSATASATLQGVVRVGTNSDCTVDANGDILLDDTKNGTTLPRFTTGLTDAEMAQIRANLGISTIPTGFIYPSAQPSATPPFGYLLCDGAAVDRTTYADLYAVIGDTYGAGDGATTFNLPDFRDCFLRGAGGTLGSAIGVKQLDAAPNFSLSFNMTHSTSGGVAFLVLKTNLPNNGAAIGGNGSQDNQSGVIAGGGIGDSSIDFMGSRASPSYGRNATTEVRPTNFAVHFFIKI